MDDETHTAILGCIICVLVFAVGALSVFQHPEWFGSATGIN